MQRDYGAAVPVCLQRVVALCHASQNLVPFHHRGIDGVLIGIFFEVLFDFEKLLANRAESRRPVC